MSGKKDGRNGRNPVLIRHKNWYWGKYIVNGSTMDNSRYTIKSEDFEEYIEEIHGWHLSEEYRNGLVNAYDLGERRR